MPELSNRLALPYMQAAQAQKHVTHNEALERLDLLVQLTVEGFDATLPPLTPSEGQIWTLGTGAVNDWAAHDGELAAWANGGWLFVTPLPGWHAANGTDLRVWTGTDWTAPDLPPLQNLEGLGIKTTSDTTNRLSVAADATLFSHAGSGHQVKLNKANTGDTASLLFQTGWSGRAEMGTAGSDSFSIKVSADGSSWHTSFEARALDGVALLAAGALIANGSAMAPAIAFSDDSDSGLYRIGANQIGVATSGNERVRITDAGVQVTGLVTGTAVTQSSTDTTAGRLLKVGDFGLGFSGGTLPLAPSDSLDGVTVTGFYRYASTTTGAPSNAGVALHLVRTLPTGAGDFLQLAVAHDGIVHTRVSTTAGPVTWGAWSQNYSQISALGAVSQVAGVPTGGLIERGSNANGDYVRFADGTQICTHTVTANLAIGVGYFGGFRSDDQTWVYPKSFATGYAVALSVTPLDGSAFGGISNGPTGTSQTVWNATAITAQPAANRVMTLTAAGRWF